MIENDVEKNNEKLLVYVNQNAEVKNEMRAITGNDKKATTAEKNDP